MNFELTKSIFFIVLTLGLLWGVYVEAGWITAISLVLLFIATNGLQLQIIKNQEDDNSRMDNLRDYIEEIKAESNIAIDELKGRSEAMLNVYEEIKSKNIEINLTVYGN